MRGGAQASPFSRATPHDAEHPRRFHCQRMLVKMLFTNTRTNDCQHIDGSEPAECVRAVVLILLRVGYQPFDPRARAYVRRLNLHVVPASAAVQS